MSEEERSELLDLLEAAPRWFSRAAAMSSAGGSASADGEWTIAQVLHHVRAADAILSARIYCVVVRDGAPLVAFDERAWGALIGASGVSLDDQAAHFALRRAELVAEMRALAQEEWSRTGKHERQSTLTLTDIASSIVSHETEHRLQIEAMLRAAT